MIEELDTWHEVWGYDGIRWEFVADFRTRAEADYFVYTFEVDGYEQLRIKKGKA